MEEEINKKELESSYSFEEMLEIVKCEIEMAEMDKEMGFTISEPITWEQLNQQKTPKNQYRIKDLLPNEGSAILSSISGEKKTWIALEQARAIVSEEMFLGPDGFKTFGCNVLYVDCENSRSELQRRCRQLGFSKNSKHKLYFYNDKELNLNTTEGATWLHAVIRHLNVKVVFIDTLRAVAGGLKEDKAEDVRMFFNRFRSLKDKGVTIVWLDHFRKPSNFEKKIPQKEHLLGSQDKTAGVEILLMLRSESGSDEIQMYQRKNRLAQEIEPFSISMKDSYLDDEFTQKRTTLEYIGEIEEKDTQKEQAKKYALEIITEGGRTTNELISIIGSEKRIGERNIRDALKGLVDSEKLQQGKKGKQNYYSLPEESVVQDEMQKFFAD